MGRRIFSALPGILTVCLVAVASAFLIAHPPARTTTAATAQDAAAEPSVRPAASSSPTGSAPPAAALAPGVIPNTPQVAIPESAPVPAPPDPKAAPALPTPAPPPAIAMPQPIIPKQPLPALPEASPLRSPQFHVQAGAFRVRGNAEELVQQLRVSHYPAVIVSRGALLVVWVGPAVDRPAAERLMKALQTDGFETTLDVSP
ncbi:MAG TPA: SPOR domain-containing protein [bacterium]|nr:SPOR domain-containing protein [bacterium]